MKTLFGLDYSEGKLFVSSQIYSRILEVGLIFKDMNTMVRACSCPELRQDSGNFLILFLRGTTLEKDEVDLFQEAPFESLIRFNNSKRKAAIVSIELIKAASRQLSQRHSEGRDTPVFSYALNNKYRIKGLWM